MGNSQQGNILNRTKTPPFMASPLLTKTNLSCRQEPFIHMEEILSFGIGRNFLAKGSASAGKSTVLGSGLSSSLKGGQSLGGLGDATNSMASVGSKSMKSGAGAGPAPSGFFAKMKAGITSRLGGDAEKGKFGQLLTGLGGKLSGALGGNEPGKQGAGGGPAAGITAKVLKGLSSRLGGDENTEPLSGILNGLSGKLIDKTRGNAFLTKLVDKLGGTEEAKKKVAGLVEKLNTGDLSKKLTVFVEGDDKNEGLINKAKNKLFAYVGIKPPVENAVNAEAGAAEEAPVDEAAARALATPAFGESKATKDEEQKPKKKNKLKQGKVFLQIQTTLGHDNVVLSEFSATEGISELFECTAVMVTDKNDVNLAEMVGKPITVLMEFETIEESDEPDDRLTPLLGKASSFFDQIKSKLGLAQKVSTAPAVVASVYAGHVLSFGVMDSIKGFFGKGGAAGGKSPTLGSGLSSKVKGGQSLGGLGDATNSMAAFGSKTMNSGKGAGPAPSGFLAKIKAGISSRLGGDAEKGKIGQLLTGLGGKLSGALGGGEAGKQGTGAGDKPGGGAAGGGITSTLLKGLSSRLGGDENTEPLANILNGLSGKIIDKTRGNAFLTKIVDKFGGSEEAKKKVTELIGKLDAGDLTKKLTVFLEGDENNEGLINKAKNKLFAFVGIQPPVQSVGNITAGAKEEKPAEAEIAKEESAKEEVKGKIPAFGETETPPEELDQRDLSKSIRYFNGIVGEIVQGPTDRTESQMTVYTVKFYPKLWLLKHSRNCRIFQKKTTMEIIAEILQENNITDVTDKTKERGQEVRDFCVQYNESNFDFISRLMESEGIFYYFLHTEDSHIMVLADSPDAHHQCPHTQKALVQEKPYGQSDFNCIQLAELVSRVVPGEQALSDYDFELPSNNLFSKVKGDGYGGRIYSYPGSYTKKAAGNDFTRMRMEADEVPKDMLYALSTIPYMEPGAFFNLKQHVRSDANKKYVAYQITHHAMQEAEDHNFYNNKFSAFDYQGGPFRPALKTPSPKIYGTQTARVTGKDGEEIWTDEYGRVKVKFHWDENSANDENTSCWVRVSQGWAGNGWGMLFTPRVGQEVVVTFLEGDPDQPLITGSVYNGEKKAPYLPDQPTISTIKSNSTKDAEGFNELRFQDLAESEEIYIHAQKDMTTDIINNRTETIERGVYTQNILTGDRILNLKGQDAPLLSRETIENNEAGVAVPKTVEISPEIKGTGNDTIVLDRGSILEHLKGEAIIEKEEQDKKDGKQSDEDKEAEEAEEESKPQTDTSKDRTGQGDLTTILTRGDRSVMIEKGDETRIIKRGNRTIIVRGGDEIRSVSGDVKETIGKNYTLNIIGNLDINVSGDVKINGANITATTNPEEVELPEYLLPPQVAKVLEERDQEKKAEAEKEKKTFSLSSVTESLGIGSKEAPDEAKEEAKFQSTTKKLGILSSVTGFAAKAAGDQAAKGGKYSKVFAAISQHGGTLTEKLKQIVADREAGKKESSEGGVGGVAVKAISAGTAFFSKKDDGSPSDFSGAVKKIKGFKIFSGKSEGGGEKKSSGALGGASDSKSAFEKISENKYGLADKLKGIMGKRKSEDKKESGASGVAKAMAALSGDKDDKKSGGLMKNLKAFGGGEKAKDGEEAKGGLGGMLSGLSKLGGDKGKDGEEATGGLAGMLSGLSKLGGGEGKDGDDATGGLVGMVSGLAGFGGGDDDDESGGMDNVVSGLFGGDEDEDDSAGGSPKGAIKFVSKTYDIEAEESISGTAANVTTDAKMSNSMKAGTKALVSAGSITQIQGGTVKVD